MIKISALATTLLISVAGQSWAAPTVLDCDVAEFSGSDQTESDTVFVQKNMRKTFQITVLSDVIHVDMRSKDFTGGRSVYDIVEVGALDYYAIRTNSVSLGTIAVDKKARDGLWTASITNQSSAYVNAWHLHCEQP